MLHHGRPRRTRATNPSSVSARSRWSLRLAGPTA
jgi:hypothetical protein